MSGFGNRSDPPPPHYDWTQHDFDSKLATAAERSLHQSFAPISGPTRSSDEDEFETWSDEKFEAAARAFKTRQARRMQGSPQPGSSGSSRGSAPNSADSNGSHSQYDLPGPQKYPLDRSQTPKPSDYAQPCAQPCAQPYSRAPRPQPQTPPYSPTSPPSSATSNQDQPIATAGGLQRTVSLFRTPSISRNDGEQLPAFTDVALPEEMVPQDMAQSGPTPPPPPPPPAPQSPPPPHTYSAPSSPPPSRARAQAEVCLTYPSPTTPQSPPPPHAFSAPSSPPPSLRNAPPLPPPPPSNVSRPSSQSPVPTPASPSHNDPPPEFVPSNNHYPIPEKTNSHRQPQLGNARQMSSSMSVYASANRTYAPPVIKFDLETVYGRASPGLPKDPNASFYSSAVSSTMVGRQLPQRPGGGRPRSTLPPAPSPSPWTTTGAGDQPGTYGGPNQTGSHTSQFQQPYQPGGFYAQPLGQQPYNGQNQPSQQGTPWNNQYPNYGLTTPPPGGQGQAGGWSVPPPAAPWPGNGGYYRQ